MSVCIAICINLFRIFLFGKLIILLPCEVILDDIRRFKGTKAMCAGLAEKTWNFWVILGDLRPLKATKHNVSRIGR